MRRIVRSRVSIRRPFVQERPTALALALSLFSPEKQRHAVTTTMLRPATELSGLFGAWRGSRLVGAIWGEILPGRTAVANPAQLVAGEPPDTGRALLNQLERYFLEHGVRFYQTQLEYAAEPEVEFLRAAGLEHAAELIFLACDPAQSNEAPPQDWEFQPYRESERGRLMAVIEQTYQGSLDLPMLDGVRSLDDVLTGYQHTGVWRPEMWQFVRRQGQDVGCLLLAEHQPHTVWEIVYLGMIPQVRGQGGGLATTRYAQRLVGKAGGRHLLLAADSQNQPALRIYQRAGFREFQRRQVFLKVLDPTRLNSRERSRRSL